MKRISLLFIVKDNKVLLFKRSATEKTNPSKYGMLGGHIEKGETPEKALEREVKEEAGVVIEKFNFLKKYVNNDVELNVFYTNSFDVDDIKLNKKEHSSFKFFTLEEILEMGSNKLIPTNKTVAKDYNEITTKSKKLNEEIKRIKQMMGIEEDYPQSFSMEEFKKISSYKGRIEYCKQHLQRLGAGSSRMVFKIDDEKVLKLAMNQKGLGQNGEEINKSNDYALDGVVAKVFDYDQSNLWLEMELAQKLTLPLFKQITGFNFEDYKTELINCYNRTKPRHKEMVNNKINPEIVEKMWENEDLVRFFELPGNYPSMSIGDLLKINTYGVVKREGFDTIIIIDFGLTDEVWNIHYKK